MKTMTNKRRMYKSSSEKQQGWPALIRTERKVQTGAEHNDRASREPAAALYKQKKSLIYKRSIREDTFKGKEWRSRQDPAEKPRTPWGSCPRAAPQRAPTCPETRTASSGDPTALRLNWGCA